MSSSWASALASLDEDLALLCESLDKIEAAESIDVAEIVEQLKAVADSSGNLRALVLSELPDVSWDDRPELEKVLEEIARRVDAREIEARRSRLLALAGALAQGAITHRRAARVTQLNRLRDDAVEELRSHSEEQSPPSVPGPEAGRWMEWACGLSEPDDTESLQALRNGFPFVDEFIANLEPGMWAFEHDGFEAVAPPPEAEQPEDAVDTKDSELRRSRLLGLANELERGSIVHHRAARVSQLNQLRDQSIKELRFHASLGGVPPTLPGPEAAEWVPWACGLKEPEDSEALENLREGFSHLDEFVANLEPDMWVPAGKVAVSTAAATAVTATAAAVALAPEKAAEPRQEAPKVEPKRQEAPKAEAKRQETSKAEAKRQEASKPEEPRVRPVPIPIERPAPAPARSTATTQKTGAPALVSQITSRIKDLSQGKSRLFILIGAVLLVGIVGATQWTLHRTHASNGPIKPVDTKAPDLNAANAGASLNTPAVAAPAPATPTPPDARNDKTAKPKDQNAATQQQQQQQQKPVNLINGAGLLTPSAMPKTAKTEEASLTAAAEPPNLAAGSLPNGASNSVLNIVKDVPVAQPKIAGQKIRVSSGVAQGQLVRQITPVYPQQARNAGIHGTVVLQAVIAKDGSVQSVKALHGPPALIPSALDAVKQWRYKPFSLNGEPAEADIQINVNFNP